MVVKLCSREVYTRHGKNTTLSTNLQKFESTIICTLQRNKIKIKKKKSFQLQQTTIHWRNYQGAGPWALFLKFASTFLYF